MKKTIRDNYRVELSPDTFGHRRNIVDDHDAMRGLLDEIERQVRRHVDGVHQVLPRWDSRDVCSHCDCGWEVLTAADVAKGGHAVVDEHSTAGEPACCEQAIAEFRSWHKIPPMEGFNVVPDMTPGACTHQAMVRHLGGDASRWSCVRCGLEVGTRDSGPDRPVHPLWPAEVVPESVEAGETA